EIVGPLQVHEWIEQRYGHYRVPCFQTRAERLAKRPREYDGISLEIVAPNARRLDSVECQSAIGRILEDEDAMALGEAASQFKKLRPAIRGET
ncbi:hypothetical protein NL533_30415, partial [Klebsiella pneumoniae]|nr:hypothetical protein [Klebsiella pneumoniae]